MKISYPASLFKLATKEHVTCSNTPNTEWVGAFANDQLIGFAGVRLWKNTALLRSVYVLPSYRLRGYGSRLIEESLAIAKEKAISQVRVLAYQPDFYRQFGFEVINQYEIRCGTVYRMRLEL